MLFRSAPLAGWNDRVVVYNRTTNRILLDTLVNFDPAAHGGVPQAGESRSRNLVFRLPDGVNGAGQLEITVFTDAQGSVREDHATAGAEANNSSLITLTSNAVSYPDLAVTAVGAPASARGGDVVTVNWTVLNQGVATGVSQWTDRIVLSADNIIGNADDVVLASVVHNGALAGGDT